MSKIPFKTDMDFEYGEVTQISPLIRRVIADNPGPFTFTGTGTFLVGRGEVGVIDPGPNLEPHIQAILSALEDGEKITHILITHTHADHSPAALPLQKLTGAPIYAFPIETSGELDDAPKLDEDQDHSFKSDHLLRDGDVIRGLNWTLTALHTPGHMRNHICFALEEEKTLFTGDHVMGWSTSIVAPPEGNMNDYMRSLERLMTRDDKIYLPTHGAAIENPKPFVQAYINHRREREAQILQQLKNGESQIRDIVKIIYTDIDPRLYPAAALSVFAHMEDLIAQNIVQTKQPARVDSRFELKR